VTKSYGGNKPVLMLSLPLKSLWRETHPVRAVPIGEIRSVSDP
jgi:hypothetical protein